MRKVVLSDCTPLVIVFLYLNYIYVCIYMHTVFGSLGSFNILFNTLFSILIQI